MSIILKKVQRVNPRDTKAAMKWYAVQKTTEKLNENEVAELIADEITLNPMEALLAIRQLRKVVQRALLDGKSVSLGNWGSFTATVHSTGADTKEALTAKNVNNVKINFQPGPELRAAMQTASFVWVEDLLKSGSSSAGTSDSSSADSETSGDDTTTGDSSSSGDSGSSSGGDSNPL